MQKSVSVKFAAAVFAALALAAAASAQTPSTGWYTSNPEADTFYISTADELAGLAKIVNDSIDEFALKTIVLMDNIDLSADGDGPALNGSTGWIPIGGNPRVGGGVTVFRGIFDGNSKTVSNIRRAASGANRGVIGGLFGYVANGVVKNLGVVDVYIYGDYDVGSVVGVLVGGIVTGCYSVGGYVSGKTRVGGVVGDMTDGSVINCYSTSAVSGGIESLGGVVGNVNSGIVANCYSTGDVRNFNDKYRHPTTFGGIVGSVINGRVTDCAALNVRVTDNPMCGNGCAPTETGRVVGIGSNGDNVILSGNLAFRGMIGMHTDVTGAETVNGADIGIEEILADNTLGKRFTEENGWTIEKGKLPGLLGKAVDIPEYLYREIAILATDRVIPRGKPDEAAVVAPVSQLTGGFTVGPNPVGRSSGAVVSFFWQGKAIKGGALTVYDAAGRVVRKLGVKDKAVAGDAGKRVVGSWGLADARGRPVAAGTYLVRGAVKVADGKRERVSALVGVR